MFLVAMAGLPLRAAVRAVALPSTITSLPQDQGAATVSGKVADASGKGMAGATVSVKDDSGQNLHATTDAKGRYKIAGIPAGTYTISVTAKGFKNFEAAGIPLKAGDAVPLDVLLEAGSNEAAAAPAEPAATEQTASAAPAQAASAAPATQSSFANWLYVQPVIPAPPPGTKALLPPTGQNQSTETVAASTQTIVNKDSKTATVTGNVSDPTGAVVANATVVISNASGVKLTATTNAQGVYAISGVPPGTYDLSVSAPNFKAFQTAGLAVNAGATLPMDAMLEAAGEKTEVNVTAGGAAQIETENAEVSGTITEKEVTSYGLNGRNFTQLITLTPGVSNQTGQDEAKVGVQGSVKYSVNGGRVEYNSFEVDGSDVLNAGLSGAESTLVVYPSLDAIQEVKVLTSNYGAQYGRTASGTVQVTTKSGGKDWHGDAYEFFRNEFFNARNYFDQTTKAPTYRRNDFGGTIGGPVWVPGHYNLDKTKTFIFFSEEARIEKSPNELRSDFNHAVPTLAERQGNFSDVCPNPYDPSDLKQLIPNGPSFNFKIASFPDCPGVPSGSGAPIGYREMFYGVNGNTVTYNNLAFQNIGGGLDPNALAILNQNLIPLPNAAIGCTSSLVGAVDHTTGQQITPCYNAVASEPTHWREELFRLDHNFNSKIHGTFRLVHDSWDTITPTPNWGTVINTFPTVQNKFVGPGIDMVVRLTQTITPSLLNETVFSYTNSHITLATLNGPGGANYQRPAGLGDPDDVGTCTGSGAVPDCPIGYLFNNGFGGKVPGVVVSGNNEAYGGSGFTADPSYTPWEHTNPTYNFRDDVSKVIGKHTLQFGLQYVLAQKNETNGALGAATGDTQGLLTVSNVNGGFYSTGNAFANFLYNDGSSATQIAGGANALQSFTQDSTQLRYYYRYQTLEPFVQDDWRLSPRVTINLGVRFSLFENFHEKYLQAYNWEPQAFSQTLAAEEKVDPYTGQLISLPGKKPIPVDLGNLDPRIINGIVRCGANGVSKYCIDNHLFNPAPRVGFAWDPKGDGKTSIRAGYGLFFEHGTGDEANAGSLEGSAPNILSLSQPFPQGYACIGDFASACRNPAEGDTNPTSYPGAFPINVTSIPVNTKYSYSQQWSLSAERQLPHNFVGTLAYVGSKGTHLSVERQLNQLQPIAPNLNPFAAHEPIIVSDANGNADCQNHGAITNPSFLLANGVTVTSNNPASINLAVACQGEPPSPGQLSIIPLTNTFRPYPGLGEIFSLQDGADSSYHGLQTTIRRTTGPLTAGVAYSYSHSIDDSSDRTDPTFVNSLDLRSNKASSNFDQRHLVNISYLYTLPNFGRSLERALLDTESSGDDEKADEKNGAAAPASAGTPPPAATVPASRAMRFIGDGWQISGITTYQSGTPFSVINNAGSSGIGVLDNAGVANGVGAGSYPDVVQDAAPAALKSNGSSFGPLLGNPNEFVAPRGLTFGDAGRNILNNPSRLNFDMSLLKHFAIKEGSEVEFRAEAFNVFNHTQFRIYDANFGNTGSNTISCYGGPNYSAGAYFPGGTDCLTGNSFLHPVDAHRPRTIQFGLKYTF
jgi:protocatechuate 3,4-dioxygenase beta subunit